MKKVDGITNELVLNQRLLSPKWNVGIGKLYARLTNLF